MKVATEVAATLRVTRLIKAARERVFAAWTTPEEIKKWFGPGTCRVLSAEVDLRVGGEYRIRVNSSGCGDGEAGKGEGGSEMEVFGEDREVKRPARLVYTWSWEPKRDFGESLVTVDFLDKEGFTEVQIIHDRLPNAEQREKHSHGWNGCLDKLEQELGGAASSNQNCPEPGTFCWNELLAVNPGGVAKFYTQLFGWKTEEMPGAMKYTLFKQDGKMVGGLMARPHEQVPPHWLAYVMVESVDASARKAAELGAKTLMPPMDIPTVGRIAVIQDPEGAPLGMFQPAKE